MLCPLAGDAVNHRFVVTSMVFGRFFCEVDPFLAATYPQPVDNYCARVSALHISAVGSAKGLAPVGKVTRRVSHRGGNRLNVSRGRWCRTHLEFENPVMRHRWERSAPGEGLETYWVTARQRKLGHVGSFRDRRSRWQKWCRGWASGWAGTGWWFGGRSCCHPTRLRLVPRQATRRVAVHPPRGVDGGLLRSPQGGGMGTRAFGVGLMVWWPLVVTPPVFGSFLAESTRPVEGRDGASGVEGIVVGMSLEPDGTRAESGLRAVALGVGLVVWWPLVLSPHPSSAPSRSHATRRVAIHPPRGVDGGLLRSPQGGGMGAVGFSVVFGVGAFCWGAGWARLVASWWVRSWFLGDCRANRGRTPSDGRPRFAHPAP